MAAVFMVFFFFGGVYVLKPSDSSGSDKKGDTGGSDSKKE